MLPYCHTAKTAHHKVEETRRKYSLEVEALRADVAVLAREKRQHRKVGGWAAAGSSMRPGNTSGYRVR